jgi:hypothetical protein
VANVGAFALSGVMLMCVGVIVISPEMEAGGGDILKKATRFFLQ